jgi:hypothetical protein
MVVWLKQWTFKQKTSYPFSRNVWVRSEAIKYSPKKHGRETHVLRGLPTNLPREIRLDGANGRRLSALIVKNGLRELRWTPSAGPKKGWYLLWGNG